MRELLITAFEDTVAQIKVDAAMMPLTRWSEAVFRFVYSRAIARRAPDVTQFFECDRIDLVLHRASERAFVEFKFYMYSTAYDPLSGIKNGMKGGPSPKNRREFEKSVEALRRRSVPPEVLKLVALFYCDPISTTGRTFDAYYGDSSGVERELKIRLLVSIGPFSSEGSECICNARLYDVGT